MLNRILLASVILIAGCAHGLIGGDATGATADSQDPEFGFSGLEIYKLGWGTHNIRIADVNHDGRKDIIVVHNEKARVECLLQRAAPDAASKPTDLDINDISDDVRFEKRPFLSEKKIFCLELGDFNHDGRVDMVYYGDPRELVVVYQNDKGEWGRRRTFDITDGARMQHAIAIGDINGDGRNDIVMLGLDGTYFVYQDKKGQLKTPVKENGVRSEVGGILLRDFNGDKRLDLLYLSFSDPEPISIRFQDQDGNLGPELRSKVDPMRAVDFGDPDGDGSDGVIAIRRKSGRLVVYQTAFEKDDGSALEGPMECYTLRNTSARRTPALALGAFSVANRIDFIVTAPDANEVEMFFRTPAGHWAGRKAFPTLQGVTQLAAIDADGDGKDELLTLSPEESTLGYSAVDDKGRLGFPRSISVPGKPTAMTVGDLDGDGKPEVVVAASNDRARSILVLTRNEEGDFTEKTSLTLKNARADPSGLRLLDMNQDGRLDVCAFLPYEGMRVLKATDDGKLVDVSRGSDYGQALVKEAVLKQTGVADVDGDGKPELLVTKKNFARALRLDDKDRLTVVDQINGRLPSSIIAGVAGADLDGDGVGEIILVDTTAHSLTTLRRSEIGGYEIHENIKIGPLGFERLIVRDLTGDGSNEFLLLTKEGCHILRPGKPRLALKEQVSYETPTRDGDLTDVVLGDLNGDGRDEFVISENTKNSLEIVVWNKEKEELRRVLSWPIFESKSYAGSRYGSDQRRGIEPREFAIVDVTGDNKPDIIILIHDRVIVYPQE